MINFVSDILERHQIPTDKPHVNAFRHLYISAYHAYKYGSTVAQGTGTGYEIITGTGESLREKTNQQAEDLQRDHAIDLHNNRIGRHIGWNARKEGKPWEEVDDMLIKTMDKLQSDGRVAE